MCVAKSRPPSKPNEIDGSRVADYYAAGRIAEIANYCECDMVSTYRLALLYELFRGSLTEDQYEQSEELLREYVAERLVEKPHWERLVESPAVAPAGVPIIVQASIDHPEGPSQRS
jgi:predicted PolB exonuclease-like 3'-5' exonuclease